AHGLLVDALLEAGYTVYALNPKAVERYRDRTRTAGAKTDPADAELLARILLTDRERHRALRSRSPQVEAIRALARDDERASRDELGLPRFRGSGGISVKVDGVGAAGRAGARLRRPRGGRVGGGGRSRRGRSRVGRRRVADRQVGTFPSAPLRTAHASFPRTR